MPGAPRGTGRIAFFPERGSAVAAASKPDIDGILEAIRAEARARGSRGAIGSYDVAGAARPERHGLAQLEPTHAADFLALPLDAFITTAYRHIVGRDPDAGGAAHYQRLLLRGRATRMEVLGRLALSPEARRRGRPLPGVLPACALALLYRIPLAGPLAALAARALALPAHWQDRSGIEAAALASGSWMKR